MNRAAAKPALTRESFIEAALSVISQVGVTRLSMRKVAVELDVSPMAVYRHFTNKEELLTAALDRFIARADVLPDTSLPWEQWVARMARGMYDALCSETSWIPLLGSLRLGAQAADVTDAFAAKLCDAGFTAEQALQAYFAMIQLTIGAVCLRASLEKQSAADASGDVSALTEAYMQNLSTQRLKIAPLLDQMAKVDPLEVSLPLLIEGIKRAKKQ